MHFFAFTKLIPILGFMALAGCGGQGDQGGQDGDDKSQTMSSSQEASTEESSVQAAVLGPYETYELDIATDAAPCRFDMRQHADVIYLVAGVDCVAEGPLHFAMEVNVISQRSGL